MLTEQGRKVVEWNARCWGDPEAQVLLPLFESDPYELMAEAAAGAITAEPRFHERAAVTWSWQARATQRLRASATESMAWPRRWRYLTC